MDKTDTQTTMVRRTKKKENLHEDSLFIKEDKKTNRQVDKQTKSVHKREQKDKHTNRKSLRIKRINRQKDKVSS